MTHTVEATAWTLIHFCWQGAVIAGVYRIASAAFSRRASQTRYVLALSALLAMLAAAVLTFAWQIRSSAPSALSYSGMSNAQVSGDFPRVLTPGMAASSHAATDNLALLRSMPGVMGWIDAFWLIGVLALAARGFGGWWVIHRLRITATAQVPAPVRASFERISRTLSLSRPVLLRVSSAIAGPVTMGTLRAIVLLPVSAVTLLSPDELEVVLAHELAHVRRADFLWNLVQTLIETLFFFHPAVWWLSGRVRHERELCCDDLALKVCPNPVVYASALFHLEEQRSRQMSLAMALDGHQPVQTLRWRIARILGETIPRNPNRPLRPFSLAALGAVLVVLLLPAPQMIAGLRPPAKLIPVAAPPVPAALPALPAVSAPIAVTQAAPDPVPASASEPTPAPAPAAKVAVEPPLVAQAQTEPSAQSPSKNSATGSTYIDRMKAAGYDVDLDKMIAMKIQNITPEYARSMSELGFGKLGADDLIACKVQGVSPETIAEFKKQGLEVKSVQDAISYKIFEVTPAFVDGMKAAGFKDLDSKKLVALRVQGVTPEYARMIAQKYPGATVDDVIKTKIFRIDADFIALAQKHGFNDLSLDKLVKLRISGLLDDESVKP
jgi:beta-lactamase regulating signal transducer with metallopeptidase domain